MKRINEKELQEETIVGDVINGEPEVKRVSIPNIITAMRIVGTFCLLFTTTLSPEFYIIYTLCGLSDIIDGFIARATNSISEFGSKLDSVADLLFYAAVFLKIIPILLEFLPLWIWVFGISIVVIRIISYTFAAIKFQRFSAMHTYMNKLTGFVFFLMPYFLREVYCAVVCVVAGVASLEEFAMHIIRKEYNTDAKSLVQLR